MRVIGISIRVMLTEMKRTNEVSSAILRSQNVSACTDVTGFGLLGHPGEMAAASGVHIELHAESLPMYDRVQSVFDRNIVRSLELENKSYASKYIDEHDRSKATDIMFDPQTSGGFLLGVASQKSPKVVELLQNAGEHSASIVGYVTEGRRGSIAIC